MPKQKTSRAAKKRFRVSGSGKLLRKRAMASHLLGKKSPKRKRSFRKARAVVGADVREVRRLLGKR